MSDERRPKPSGEYTVEQIENALPILKIMSFFSSNIRKQSQEVERQLKNVKRMMTNRDLFARIYSPLGWVNYDRLSTEIVSTVLATSIENGEATLTKYHLDPVSLSLLGYRFNTAHFQPWRALYERAVERASVEDYISAIPLVLSTIDGICTTYTGRHPFSGAADTPVFDSSTSGPGGLSEGLALLGSTRRKLDTSPISAPFRHGIVHGLNPNYGSPIVAAKVLNLLQGTVDYFDRRRDEAQRMAKASEDQKPVDLRELGRGLCRNAEIDRALKEWRPRPAVSGIQLASSDELTELPGGSPEAFAVEYLTLLIARNFGGLAKATVDYPKRSISYRAGRLREDLKEITVTRWTITGIEDTAPADSRVTTTLVGQLKGEPWGDEHSMRLTFADAEYDSLIRGQPGGSWAVMPDFLAGLWLLAVRSARVPSG